MPSANTVRLHLLHACRPPGVARNGTSYILNTPLMWSWKHVARGHEQHAARRRADSQCRNVAATTGQGRQTHCIPHQTGKENKQQTHTPTTLTPATLPTHASPATARTPTTASASNSSVRESSSSPGNFSSHGARETEQGRRVINWANKPLGGEELPPGLGSNHVPGRNRELCAVAWEGNFPDFSYKTRGEHNTESYWAKGAELNRKRTSGIKGAWKDPGLFPPPGNHSTLSQAASLRCRYFLITQKPFCKHCPCCPQKQIWSSLYIILPLQHWHLVTYMIKRRETQCTKIQDIK